MIFTLWLAAVTATAVSIGVVAERQRADNAAYNTREEARPFHRPHVTVTDGGAADEPGRHAEERAKGTRYQRRAQILRTPTQELRTVPKREVRRGAA